MMFKMAFIIVTHRSANLSGDIIMKYASREYACREYVSREYASREYGVAPPTTTRFIAHLLNVVMT